MARVELLILAQPILLPPKLPKSNAFPSLASVKYSIVSDLVFGAAVNPPAIKPLVLLPVPTDCSEDSIVSPNFTAIHLVCIVTESITL